MILIDSSAWVEYLRDTGSPVCHAVDDLLASDVATCAPVRMELLAGARNDVHVRQLRGLLARATLIATEPIDYDDAAQLYRTCRRQGDTVRRMIDCLIASHAIRVGVPVLHADTDFDVLARHTPLLIA